MAVSEPAGLGAAGEPNPGVQWFDLVLFGMKPAGGPVPGEPMGLLRIGGAVLTTGKHDVLLRYSNFRDGVRDCMQARDNED